MDLNHNWFDIIPDDILKLILELATSDFRSKILLRWVCRRFYAIVTIDAFGFDPLDEVYKIWNLMNDQILASAYFKNLTKLRTSIMHSVTKFPPLPKLQQLIFVGRAQTELDFMSLRNLSSLTFLDISNTTIPKNIILSQQLPNLLSLKISLNGLCCDNLNGLSNLTLLEIFGISNKADFDFNSYPQLQELSIANCKFDGSKIDKLLKLEKLSLLNLKYVSTNYYLTSFSKLTQLILKFDHVFDPNAISIPSLKKLEIVGDMMLDHHLSKLTNLEDLSIYSNKRISKIELLTKLTRLESGDCMVRQFKNTGSVVKLKVKKLSQNSITDFLNLRTLIVYSNSTLVNLNHLSNLEYLHLDQCTISNNGISRLTNLKNLSTFVCWNIK